MLNTKHFVFVFKVYEGDGINKIYKVLSGVRNKKLKTKSNLIDNKIKRYEEKFPFWTKLLFRTAIGIYISMVMVVLN